MNIYSYLDLHFCAYFVHIYTYDIFAYIYAYFVFAYFSMFARPGLGWPMTSGSLIRSLTVTMANLTFRPQWVMRGPSPRMPSRPDSKIWRNPFVLPARLRSGELRPLLHSTWSWKFMTRESNYIGPLRRPRRFPHALRFFFARASCKNGRQNLLSRATA